MLTFDTENYDTDTMHSTSSNTGRLVATTAGKYIIEGQVEFAASSTGVRIAQIRLNGSTIIASNRKLSLSTGVTQLGVDTVYNLAANDYVELLVNQTSLAALNADAGLGTTWFAATRQADDGATGATGATGPSTGAAGGVLSGTYPNPGFALALCAPLPLFPGSNVAAPGANVARACRIIIPRTGNLRDIAVYIGTSSGNYDVGVYNTVVTTRTALWTKGSTASPGTGWRILGDPNLAVTAGDQIDLAVVFDNGTATLLRTQTAANAVTQLPTGFLVTAGGGLPLVYWAKTTAFPLPTPTTAESGLTGSLDQFIIIARIS